MKSKLPIEIKKAGEYYWPPRRYGREPGNNNDTALVALALVGLKNETYKSYVHAARELEPQSVEYGKGFQTVRVLGSRVERLQRAIGKAYKLKYGCSVHQMRKA